MLSIITPAFNEAANLEAMRTRLAAAVASTVGDDWEWLVVDDHSADATFDVLARLAQADPRVRGLRLSRNSGSHAAITCGLHHVNGDAAVMLAGDLQDPPELLQALVERWRAGAQVVWASRRTQPGETSHAGFASVYYWVMRHVVGMKEMPANGADFFLADRAVIDAFRTFDIVWTLTSGGPGRSTELFSLYAYVLAFLNLDLGRGSAAAIIGGLIILLLGVVMYRIVDRIARA